MQHGHYDTDFALLVPEPAFVIVHPRHGEAGRPLQNVVVGGVCDGRIHDVPNIAGHLAEGDDHEVVEVIIHDPELALPLVICQLMVFLIVCEYAFSIDCQ